MMFDAQPAWSALVFAFVWFLRNTICQQGMGACRGDVDGNARGRDGGAPVGRAGRVYIPRKFNITTKKSSSQ